MKTKSYFSFFIFGAAAISGLVGLFAFAGSVSALNIDPANQYVWGENIGWVNFGSPEGDVDVTPTAMDGYAWGENVGWISLTCNNTASCGTVNYGVTIAGSVVSGYAWGENIGWVSFNCLNTASCGTVDYGVSLNTATGDFSGFAWGENVGWIVFNCTSTASCGTTDYKLRTSAVFATPTPTPANQGSIPTPTPTPAPAVTPSPTATAIPPTLTPRPSVRPTPSAFPTPTAPPPGGTPTSPPGTPSTPPVILFINRLSGLFDSLFAFLGLANRTVCVGPLGIAACSAALLPLLLVLLALLAGLLLGEWLAALFALLLLLGIRRKVKPWGVVYNSATKRPIPFAKVQLFDATGRRLETRYADRDGRYGFATSAASMHQDEVRVQVKVFKSGFTFPTTMTQTGTDFIVYENLYRGGMIVLTPNTVPHHDIPLDATAHAHLSWSGFGHGLVGTTGDTLLSFAFYIGLVVVPLNWWFLPTTTNLVILIIFLVASFIRIFILHRPYGLTKNALTGKRLPYALVVLNDQQGNRQGFAVSDEQGRYVLPCKQNGDYEIVGYTPDTVVPQRSVRMQGRSTSRLSSKSWITNTISI